MTVILTSKICKGDIKKYDCKSVKITGTKIEIHICDNYDIIWNTTYCDIEINN